MLILRVKFLVILPLCIAHVFGHFEVVKFLVEHNADIESKDSYGASFLGLACRRGDLDMVKFLVEHNADIEHRGWSDDATPLNLGCRNSHLEVVKFLIKHNADIERSSQKILHSASK